MSKKVSELPVVNLKCESDSPSYDQSVHKVFVLSKDESGWTGFPVENKNCWIWERPLYWPSFAWKEAN